MFGNPKYSLVAIIDKEDKETIQEIRDAIEHVKKRSLEKWGGKIPDNFRSPLHDGDREKPDNPIFEHCYYINAKCKEAPQVVDQNVEPITDPDDLYSGCYGNISLTFYAYNCGGNKGIGVLLGNIQKIKDGPKLNGRLSAKEEFRPVAYGRQNEEVYR